MKLDDLKALATAEPLKGGNTATVVSLRAGDDIDRSIHALGRFFAEHDKHTAVELEIDGSTVGYLNRQDFYSDEDDRSKLGGAQSGQLPGPPEYTFLKLVCPVGDCSTQVLKIHYDDHNPDRCPIHPDQVLQVVN